jgi:FG-GAP-like repeat
MRGHFFRSAVLLLAGTLAGCGGGGGGDHWGLDNLWLCFDAKIVDVDGDGRPDLVAATDKGRSGHIQVYLQSASGTFSLAGDYQSGISPWRLYVTDMDGDGVPDIVFSDGADGTVRWLSQDSGTRGHFLPPQVIETTLAAGELGVADLNGDGLTDLAISDGRYGSTRMGLRIQDPAYPGTFLPLVDLSMPGAPSNIVAGDIDGDGRADLFSWVYTNAYLSPQNGMFGVQYQKADGSLGPFTSLATLANLSVERLALGEPRANGRRDLLAFCTSTAHGYHRLIEVIPQSDDGTFAQPRPTEVSDLQGRDDVAFGDLNGDGLTDAVTLGVDSNSNAWLTVWIQSITGAFIPARTYALPDLPTTVALGDLDGDGRLDLVWFSNSNVPYAMIQDHDGSGSFGASHALQ